MDNPNLSVIIPCHNLGLFIENLLRSLKNQVLENYKVEYIFVLDACEDDTEEQIRNSKLPCTILNVNYHSCGLARNEGLKIAKGDYVWMMDGDDWLMRDFAIKVALDKAYAEDANMLRIEYSKERYPYAFWSMVWQYVFKRTFIEGIYFDDKQPGEDDRWTIRVLNKLGLDYESYYQLPYLKTPLYYYNYGRFGSNMMLFYEQRAKQGN